MSHLNLIAIYGKITRISHLAVIGRYTDLTIRHSVIPLKLRAKEAIGYLLSSLTSKNIVHVPTEINAKHNFSQKKTSIELI